MTIGRSVSWMGASQVISLVLQFGASVVLARYLTPYEMGIYAVALATVGLLAIVQAFGLQSLVVREEVLDDDILATIFTLNVLLSLLLASATAGLSYFGGRYLGDDGVTSAMLALSLNPLIGIFDFLPGARLERAGQFKTLALAGTASGIVAAGSTIIGAMSGASYMSAAYAGWASALTYAIILNFVGRTYIGFQFGFRRWRRVAHFGLQTLATAGLHQIGGRVSDLFLTKLQGISGLGIYTRASNLNGLIWNNIHLAVGRVMFVDFSTIHRNGISLRDRYIATLDVTTVLLWPAFGGLALLGGPLIASVYGTKWIGAAAPLSMLAVSSMILVSITMTWEVYAAKGRLARQTQLEFYNAIFTTIAFIMGGYYGLTSAAASRVISALFSVRLYWRDLNEMTETSLSDFLRIYARNAAITALTLLPSLTTMACFEFAATTPVIYALLSTALGIAIWLGCLAATNHLLYRELRGRFGLGFGDM